MDAFTAMRAFGTPVRENEATTHSASSFCQEVGLLILHKVEEVLDRLRRVDSFDLTGDD